MLIPVLQPVQLLILIKITEILYFLKFLIFAEKNVFLAAFRPSIFFLIFLRFIDFIYGTFLPDHFQWLWSIERHYLASKDLRQYFGQLRHRLAADLIDRWRHLTAWKWMYNSNYLLVKFVNGLRMDGWSIWHA